MTRRATRCRDKHLAAIAARVLAGEMTAQFYSVCVADVYAAFKGVR